MPVLSTFYVEIRVTVSIFKADDNNIYQPDNDLTSKFNQDQDILAAYADYQLKLGKFGGKAGVRFEHTIMDVEYKYMPDRNFDSNFDDLVPSASFTYQLAPTKNHSCKL